MERAVQRVAMMEAAVGQVAKEGSVRERWSSGGGPVRGKGAQGLRAGAQPGHGALHARAVEWPCMQGAVSADGGARDTRGNRVRRQGGTETLVGNETCSLSCPHALCIVYAPHARKIAQPDELPRVVSRGASLPTQVALGSRFSCPCTLGHALL